MLRSPLDIQIQTPPGGMKPGATLYGHLEAPAGQRVDPGQAQVTLRWRTMGSCNRESGPEIEARIGPAEMVPGRPTRVPFALELPNGPVSCQATHFWVEWVLRGRIDAPWALDPKDDQVIVLRDARGPGYDFGPRIATATAKGAGLSAAVTGTIVTAALALVFVSLGLVIAVRNASGAGFDRTGVVVGGMVFALIGAAVFWRMLAALRARRAIGPVTYEAASHACPGQGVPVVVTLQPNKALQLEHAALTIRSRQRTVSGSGKHRRTRFHVAHEQRTTMQGPSVCNPGTANRFSGHAHVPLDALYSFGATHARNDWTLTIELKFDGYAAWREERPLLVGPPANAWHDAGPPPNGPPLDDGR